jgi:superfamily II DNA helicase RecQ
MPYKSFAIPVHYGDWAERAMNDFLRTHRVLAVDRRWVDQGENSFWAVWIEYLESASEPRTGNMATASSGSTAPKGKVDYKERLSGEEFEVYVKLRNLRKELAREDGVQLYTVFTNEQLAQMVQQRVRAISDLQQIPGVGEARLEKYGPRVLQMLAQLWKDSNETNRQPAGQGG